MMNLVTQKCITIRKRRGKKLAKGQNVSLLTKSSQNYAIVHFFAVFSLFVCIFVRLYICCIVKIILSTKSLLFHFVSIENVSNCHFQELYNSSVARIKKKHVWASLKKNTHTHWTGTHLFNNAVVEWLRIGWREHQTNSISSCQFSKDVSL